MRHKVYDIHFTKNSKKQYEAFPSKVRSELANIVEEIAKNPLIGKPLQGPLKGQRSKRIGKFRIVYRQINSELIILIINIEHRKKAYSRK